MNPYFILKDTSEKLLSLYGRYLKVFFSQNALDKTRSIQICRRKLLKRHI